MSRLFVRVMTTAVVASGLLLAGGFPAVALAAPDSPGNSAGGNGNGGNNGNSGTNGKGGGQSGKSPGTHSSNPGNPGNGSANADATPGGKSAKPAKPVKPRAANGSAGDGVKTLPEKASPVAKAAVNGDTPSESSPGSAAEPPAATTTPVPSTPPTPLSPPDSAGQAVGQTPAIPGGGDSPAPTTAAPGRAPVAATAAIDGIAVTVAGTAATPLSGGSAPLPDAPAVTPSEDGWITQFASSLGKTASDVASTVVREVREALQEVTLKDLAMAALPGIAGILFLMATGVGLGHRQARFGFAIEPSSGLLAARGPLGVVGSGSFVKVSPRLVGSKAVGRRGPRALDSAA